MTESGQFFGIGEPGIFKVLNIESDADLRRLGSGLWASIRFWLDLHMMKISCCYICIQKLEKMGTLDIIFEELPDRNSGHQIDFARYVYTDMDKRSVLWLEILKCNKFGNRIMIFRSGALDPEHGRILEW